MAIRLITGVPGTGKTYLALNTLLEDYFKYNKKTKEYEKKKDVTVITNIDELKLDHINLNDAIKKSGGNLEHFFSKDYQEKIHHKYNNVVYFIDECQQYFPIRFRNQDVFFFFEYHRHFGFDIYLITQDRLKISKEISLLAEIEFRAVKRTLSLVGELKYNIMSDREIIDRKLLRPKQKIFDLYKSANIKETKKIKNPMMKIIVVCIVLCLVAGCFLKKRLYRNIDKPKNEKPASAIATTEKSQNTPSEFVRAPKKGIHQYYEIENKIWINNKLKYIVDPFTNKLTPPELFPYTLKNINGNIYTLLPPSKLMELQNLHTQTFANSHPTTSPPPEDKSSFIF